MAPHPSTWIVAGLLSIAVVACSQQTDGDDNTNALVPPVLTATVQSHALGLERRYPAVIQPAQEVALSFEVSGRIIELPIRAAMEVEEGDVIARLDPTDFEQALIGLRNQKSQAEAQLRSMTAGARAEDLASLQAQVDAAQAQVDQAQEQFNRTETLFADGITTAARRDQDRATLQVAQAQLRSAQEELNKGLAGARAEDVEAQQAAIAALDAQIATAEKNLADATLRAPFSGIIALREVDNFTSVQAKSTIAVLQELNRLELVFDVPGPDVARFANAEGVSSQVELAVRPGEFIDSELVEFSTQADRATQTFRGRVAIDRPEDVGILPGMIGSVIVSEGVQSEQSVLVPLGAVAAEADGSKYVWVVGDGDTVTKQLIETGEARGEAILVSSGLAAGDVVVTAGLAKLQPDMKVRPIIEIGG